MLERLYQCSYCQTVLSGRVKAEVVEKTYLCITGSISVQIYDEETHWRGFLYATPKPQKEGEKVQTYFCNLQCLGGYISYKQKVEKQKREEWLREQASEEEINRHA